MNGSFRLLAAAAAVATMSVSAVLAQDPGGKAAPADMSPGPSMGAQTKPMQAAPVADSMALRNVQAAAQQAQTKLNAPQPDALVLAKAAKAKDVDLAKQVLLRNGYTARQLEGATIVLEDKTGGAPVGGESRIKITIKGSCCPLTITIIIDL